jgi:farnesol dehydrogenase
LPWRRAAHQDVVLLYPGVVYGPGELTDGNLVVQMVADHLNGRLPGIIGPGDRLWSYSFVDDVAEGHALALEKGRSGERYFLCGENATLGQFFDALLRVTSVAPPRRHIPFGSPRRWAARCGCGPTSPGTRRSSPTRW